MSLSICVLVSLIFLVTTMHKTHAFYNKMTDAYYAKINFNIARHITNTACTNILAILIYAALISPNTVLKTL